MSRMKTPSRRGPDSYPLRPSQPFVFISPALGLTLGVITLLEMLRYQLICQSAPVISVVKDAEIFAQAQPPSQLRRPPAALHGAGRQKGRPGERADIGGPRSPRKTKHSLNQA